MLYIKFCIKIYYTMFYRNEFYKFCINTVIPVCSEMKIVYSSTVVNSFGKIPHDLLIYRFIRIFLI